MSCMYYWLIVLDGRFGNKDDSYGETHAEEMLKIGLIYRYKYIDI